MNDLVTQAEARRWLRLGPAGDGDDDADLADKVSQASAIFLRYHSDGALPEEWSSGSPAQADPALVPDDVKQAVAIILHDLWDNRGENPVARAYGLMRLIRGPALA